MQTRLQRTQHAQSRSAPPTCQCFQLWRNVKPDCRTLVSVRWEQGEGNSEFKIWLHALQLGICDAELFHQGMQLLPFHRAERCHCKKSLRHNHMACFSYPCPVSKSKLYALQCSTKAEPTMTSVQQVHRIRWYL